MSRPALLVSTVLLFLGFLSPTFAQTDGFYWTSGFLGSLGGGCQMCVYDAGGAQVANFPYPGIFTVPHMAKAPDGTVWATDGLTGSLLPYTLAGIGTPIAVPNISKVCVDSFGDVWTYSGGFLAVASLERRNSQGTLIQTFTSGGLASHDMAGDPFGNVWVLDALLGSLERANAAGGISGPFATGQTGTPARFKIDQDGNAWVLYDVGPTAKLVKLDNSGVVQLTLPLAGAQNFDVDPRGFLRILRSGPPYTVEVRDAAGTFLGSTSLNTANTYEGIAVDAAGRSWLSSLNSSLLEVRSCSGLHLMTIPVAVPVATSGYGDQTGKHLAAVVGRSLDSDLDGVVSATEVRVGTDPLSALSVPPTLGLSGTPVPGNTVTLGLSIPSDAGFPYIIGASLGVDGIPVGPSTWCREIPLSLDPFLLFWLGAQNTVATGVAGTLNPAGQATLSLAIPAAPLTGLTIVLAGVTIDLVTSTVASISAPFALQIQ